MELPTQHSTENFFKNLLRVNYAFSEKKKHARLRNIIYSSARFFRIFYFQNFISNIFRFLARFFYISCFVDRTFWLNRTWFYDFFFRLFFPKKNHRYLWTFSNLKTIKKLSKKNASKSSHFVFPWKICAMENIEAKFWLS